MPGKEHSTTRLMMGPGKPRNSHTRESRKPTADNPANTPVPAKRHTDQILLMKITLQTPATGAAITLIAKYHRYGTEGAYELTEHQADRAEKALGIPLDEAAGHEVHRFDPGCGCGHGAIVSALPGDRLDESHTKNYARIGLRGQDVIVQARDQVTGLWTDTGRIVSRDEYDEITHRLETNGHSEGPGVILNAGKTEAQAQAEWEEGFSCQGYTC